MIPPIDTDGSTDRAITVQELIEPSPHGADLFRLALENAATREQLMKLFTQYVAFNGPFGAGVAHLAGQVAVRRGLFIDRADPITSLADRGGKIAAHIFQAAVDEFGGPDAAMPSHRELAQNSLKAMAVFFECDAHTMNQLSLPLPTTDRARNEVEAGYGVDYSRAGAGRLVTNESLFHAIGFHLGSERLAGDEFLVIDRFLRDKHQRLVEFMEQVHPEIADVQTYVWIKVHTTVEEDHAAHALTAANLALKYCGDDGQASIAKKQVLGGFRHFAQIQSDFLRRL